MGQYEELRKEIETLRKEVAKKANVNSPAAVYPDHKENWDWAKV